MKGLRRTLAAGLLAVALGMAIAAPAQDRTLPPSQATPENLSDLHDFDFLVGKWRVHHIVKRPIDSDEWTEFDGTCVNWALVDGRGNVEEHRFNRPTGITYGVAIRSYDPQTAEWAIWWIDGRAPHGAMDPPVKGRFEKGVGTFYSDGTLDGEPIRVRFIWSQITDTSARWEQAYSSDGGIAWETNWIMEFQRVQ
jgi:hypothetical protein